MFTRIDKALTAGFLQAVAVYGTLAATGGKDQLVQIAAAVGAGIVAGLAVFFIPNKPVVA